MQEVQGESNTRQIVVTILCRFPPPFHLGELALFRYRKTPLSVGSSILFLQGLLYESTAFPRRDAEGKRSLNKVSRPFSCLFFQAILVSGASKGDFENC